MPSYQILKKHSEYVAVKKGWSWPAFFFTWIWGVYKQLWLHAIALFGLFFLTIVLAQPAKEAAEAYLAGIPFIAARFAGGLAGNVWVYENLLSKGFSRVSIVQAGDAQWAVRNFLASGEAPNLVSVQDERESSPPPRELDSTRNAQQGQQLDRLGISVDQTGRYWIGGHVFSSASDAIASFLGVAPAKSLPAVYEDDAAVSYSGGFFWYRGIRYDSKDEAKRVQHEVKKEREGKLLEDHIAGWKEDRAKSGYCVDGVRHASLAEVASRTGLVFFEDDQTGELSFKGLVPADSNKGPDVDASPMEESIEGAQVVHRVGADKLRELKSLLDEGVLTQSEFDQKKAEILKNY